MVKNSTSTLFKSNKVTVPLGGWNTNNFRNTYVKVTLPIKTTANNQKNAKLVSALTKASSIENSTAFFMVKGRPLKNTRPTTVTKASLGEVIVVPAIANVHLVALCR